jgi:hypothetical protein
LISDLSASGVREERGGMGVRKREREKERKREREKERKRERDHQVSKLH